MTIERIDNDRGYSPDNCKWATRSEQCLNRGENRNNTSGFRGVSFRKSRNAWEARIGHNYKSFNLGLHASKELAALAYNAAAIKYHGANAKLNQISQGG